MNPDAALEDRAHAFAEQLSSLVSAFCDASVPFEAKRLGDKFSVRPSEPVLLTVNRRPLLSLDITYRCMIDHARSYLVVDRSWVKVYGGPKVKGDPLFRYEYDRAVPDDLPAAHLHVHAHRDHLVMAMALAGEAGAPRRATDPEDFTSGARMSAVHFPVGGHRFRPGLEDVLQMLHSEFGVDVGSGWQVALQASRETYRRDQTGSVVRDCPSDAVRVLRELGYRVEEPTDGVHPDRVDRLRAY